MFGILFIVFCGTSPVTRFADINKMKNKVVQNANPSLGKTSIFATRSGVDKMKKSDLVKLKNDNYKSHNLSPAGQNSVTAHDLTSSSKTDSSASYVS